MEVFAIKKWNETFENASSRKVVRVRYIPFPIEQGSLRFRSLLQTRDDAMAYAHFIAIVQLAASCPCRGLLWRSDRAMTIEDVSAAIGIPVKHLRKSWTILTSTRIGWIREVQIVPSVFVATRGLRGSPKNAEEVELAAKGVLAAAHDCRRALPSADAAPSAELRRKRLTPVRVGLHGRPDPGPVRSTRVFSRGSRDNDGPIPVRLNRWWRILQRGGDQRLGFGGLPPQQPTDNSCEGRIGKTTGLDALNQIDCKLCIQDLVDAARCDHRVP